MKLVVGLGNIGAQYARTRHNIGFMVVDALAGSLEVSWKHESKLKAEVAVAGIGTNKLILAKPDTMMNLSGESIQRLMQYYKLDAGDVWVLFDDLDIPFGRMRLRTSGSSGGHQGISSAIAHIGTGFVRARIGISMNDRAKEPSEVYVLKPFNEDEQAELPRVVTAAAGIIETQLQLASLEDSTFDLIS